MGEAVASIWRQAEPLGQRCSFRKNQVIIRQGSPSTAFYFIREGLVQTSAVFPDGSVFVFEILRANGMFGDATSLTSTPYMVSGVALEPCELLRFNINPVIAAISTQPEIAKALLQVLAQRQYVLAQRLQLLSHMDSEVVVGGLLAGLAQLQGEAGVDQRGKVSVPLTHEQIASMTGLTRVTISRTIKRLRERGMIQTDKSGIRISDPAHLSRLVGSATMPGTAPRPGIRVRQSDLPSDLMPFDKIVPPHSGPDRRRAPRP